MPYVHPFASPRDQSSLDYDHGPSSHQTISQVRPLIHSPPCRSYNPPTASQASPARCFQHSPLPGGTAKSSLLANNYYSPYFDETMSQILSLQRSPLRRRGIGIGHSPLSDHYSYPPFTDTDEMMLPRPYFQRSPQQLGECSDGSCASFSKDTLTDSPRQIGVQSFQHTENTSPANNHSHEMVSRVMSFENTWACAEDGSSLGYLHPKNSREMSRELLTSRVVDISNSLEPTYGHSSPQTIGTRSRHFTRYGNFLNEAHTSSVLNHPRVLE